MIRFVFGVFIMLHGLVHLLYFGHSGRYFQLQPGLVWPDGSWAFSRILGEIGTRNLASILLVLTTIGFVAGGIGIFIQQAWWRPVVIDVTVFSAVLFVLFWDGILQMLDGKGGIGILINVAILVVLLAFHWPK